MVEEPPVPTVAVVELETVVVVGPVDEVERPELVVDPVDDVEVDVEVVVEVGASVVGVVVVVVTPTVGVPVVATYTRATGVVRTSR